LSDQRAPQPSPGLSTVQILAYLYSVVVALALTSSVQTIVNPGGIPARNLFEIPVEELLLFGSFVLVIVPFYHGAIRALVTVFREDITQTKGGTMLITYGAMLLEALVFYAMATSIRSLFSFIFWFAFLMVIDTIWVGLAHASGATNQDAPVKWGILNGGVAVFLVLFWNIATDQSLSRYALILTASIVRTSLDYYLTRDYYFPTARSVATNP